MRQRWYDGAIARRASPLLALVALGLLAGACGDDAPSAGEARADQARRAAAEAGLDDEVADVLARAAASIDETYRVVYELEDPEGGTRRVVVTQRPPDRRVDVSAADGTEDATVDVGGRTHQCTRPPGGDWTCEELGRPRAVAGFDEAAVEELAEALAGAADDYDLAVEDREVAGAGTSCIVTRLRADAAGDPALGAEGALCVAETGALLLVERPVGTLRALEYSTDVGDGAFDLPA